MELLLPLFKTSESLSIATQAVDLQRDRFTKQIVNKILF